MTDVLQPIAHTIEVRYRHPLQARLAPATSGSAAVDLRAYPFHDDVASDIMTPEDRCWYGGHNSSAGRAEYVELSPSCRLVRVCTRVAINMPVGMCALILPRSGLGSRGVRLANTVGLIDSDYQGEISAHLYYEGTQPLRIHYADRILQMLFLQTNPNTIDFKCVDEFSRATSRGVGGFGSTGNG